MLSKYLHLYLNIVGLTVTGISLMKRKLFCKIHFETQSESTKIKVRAEWLFISKYPNIL